MKKNWSRISFETEKFSWDVVKRSWDLLMYLVVILLLLFPRHEKCMTMMMFVVAIYKNVLCYLSFGFYERYYVENEKKKRIFVFVWRFINLFTSELFSFFIRMTRFFSKKNHKKPYSFIYGEFVFCYAIFLYSFFSFSSLFSS